MRQEPGPEARNESRPGRASSYISPYRVQGERVVFLVKRVGVDILAEEVPGTMHRPAEGDDVVFLSFYQLFVLYSQPLSPLFFSSLMLLVQ